MRACCATTADKITEFATAISRESAFPANPMSLVSKRCRRIYERCLQGHPIVWESRRTYASSEAADIKESGSIADDSSHPPAPTRHGQGSRQLRKAVKPRVSRTQAEYNAFMKQRFTQTTTSSPKRTHYGSDEEVARHMHELRKRRETAMRRHHKIPGGYDSESKRRVMEAQLDPQSQELHFQPTHFTKRDGDSKLYLRPTPGQLIGTAMLGGNKPEAIETLKAGGVYQDGRDITSSDIQRENAMAERGDLPTIFQLRSDLLHLKTLTSLRRVIYHQIDTAEACYHLIDVLNILNGALDRCSKSSSPHEVLKLVNGLKARFVKLVRADPGSPSKPILILAMEWAIKAGEARTLRNHLKEVRQEGFYVSQAEFMRISNLIAEYPASPKKPGDDLDYQGRKTGMASVLTGQASPLQTAESGQQATSDQLLCLKDHLRTDSTPMWLSYLRACTRLSCFDEVNAAWTAFQKLCPPSSTSTNSNRVISFVQGQLHNYLDANAPEQAWALLEDAEKKYGIADNLSEMVWRKLVKHPEYITSLKKLPPSVGKIAAKECARLLAGVEQELGIRWTGGEEGSHELTGEQWDYADQLLRGENIDIDFIRHSRTNRGKRDAVQETTVQR